MESHEALKKLQWPTERNVGLADRGKASITPESCGDIRATALFGTGVLVFSIPVLAVAPGVSLANAPYLASFGAGVTMHFNWADIAWDPYFEFGRMDYRSSSL
jgi:hypothetical protein